MNALRNSQYNHNYCNQDPYQTQSLHADIALRDSFQDFLYIQWFIISTLTVSINFCFSWTYLLLVADWRASKLERRRRLAVKYDNDANSVFSTRSYIMLRSTSWSLALKATFLIRVCWQIQTPHKYHEKLQTNLATSLIALPQIYSPRVLEIIRTSIMLVIQWRRLRSSHRSCLLDATSLIALKISGVKI